MRFPDATRIFFPDGGQIHAFALSKSTVGMSGSGFADKKSAVGTSRCSFFDRNSPIEKPVSGFGDRESMVGKPGGGIFVSKTTSLSRFWTTADCQTAASFRSGFRTLVGTTRRVVRRRSPFSLRSSRRLDPTSEYRNTGQGNPYRWLLTTCDYQLPVFKYSSIAFAAFRPAPIARITVAPPVTMSPAAKTPCLLVFNVSGLVWM